MADPRTPATASVQAKASSLRGFVATLEARGLLADVRARVSPQTRAMIDALPPSSTWISHGVLEEIAIATVALVGAQAWREITFHAARDAVVPLMRVGIEGALRLFGATPATLFSRWRQLSASSVRGIVHEYVASGPRQGEVLVTFEGCRDVPIEVFHATGGALALAFDLTDTTGTVSDPEVVPGGQGNRARYRVRW